MEPFDLRKWDEFRDCAPRATAPIIIDQVVIDSRRISSKHALFVALSGNNFDGHDFLKNAYKAGARHAIVRADLPLTDLPPGLKLYRVADPLRALQQIAKAYRNERRAKIIAITGSLGKTMLKDLLATLTQSQYAIFASPESFNSQLGVALSLLKIQENHEIAFIEVGISKPGEMRNHLEMVRPDHVIITHISSAHIASMGTKDAIAYEKMQLLSGMPPSNWCLVPDDPFLRERMPPQVLPYFWPFEYDGLPQVIPEEATEHYALNYEVVFPSGRRHFGYIQEGLSYVIDLIRMGTKAAWLLGIREENIAKGLDSYFPEPMRIELWKTQLGCTLINDTYSADPMSCDIALAQFESLGEESGKKIFLFGGLREHSSHPDIDMQRVAHAVAKHRVDTIILWQQQHQKPLLEALSLICPNCEVITAANEKSAFAIAKARVGHNDLVIVKGPKKIPIGNLVADFDESLPNNQVIINLSAIGSNLEMIRARLGPSSRLMVMVKALAYGTDDVRIAKFLQTAGIDILGVSYVDEGVMLRKAGVNADIYVINATEYEAAKAVKWNLEIGVSEPLLLAALVREANLADKRVKVHLHVDTGMSRLGCRPNEALALAEQIATSPNLIFEGIMTHFASADDPREDAFTMHQATLFTEVIDSLDAAGHHPKYRHAANSAASLRFAFPQFNMARIGLAAYGLHASPSSRELLDLRPAISLASRIVGINECHSGDTISYGRAHTVTRDEARIAVLPIGYYDGLHRNYSGKNSVIIRGRAAPMVGKICMDYMMCDISDIPLASIGDPVLIFGEDDHGNWLSPEDLATSGGSIVHELMTCLGPRIRRLFIYDESLRPR
jgi:alanine racemase/UDP-N-acetylmuramoyl-tripeptide--D-alanyl-D-alanine ligase